MLFDIYRLREKGNRLPAEVVRRRGAVRGHLSDWEYVDGWRGASPNRIRAVTLTKCGLPSGQELIPALHAYAVTQITATGMRIRGFEYVESLRKKTDVYPQTWWCIPITEKARADAQGLPLANTTEATMPR